MSRVDGVNILHVILGGGGKSKPPLAASVYLVH